MDDGDGGLGVGRVAAPAECTPKQTGERVRRVCVLCVDERFPFYHARFPRPTPVSSPLRVRLATLHLSPPAPTLRLFPCSVVSTTTSSSVDLHRAIVTTKQARLLALFVEHLDLIDESNRRSD